MKKLKLTLALLLVALPLTFVSTNASAMDWCFYSSNGYYVNHHYVFTNPYYGS